MTFWDMPEDGEMILFRNENEVKFFFQKMGCNEEELAEYYGITVDRSHMPEEDEDMFVGDRPDIASIYPVFEGEREFQHSQHIKNHERIFIPTDKMTLDKSVYPSFPCMAFILVVDTFDRMGSVKFRWFNVTPLRTANTVHDFINIENEHSEEWDERIKKYLEYEKRQYSN